MKKKIHLNTWKTVFQSGNLHNLMINRIAYFYCTFMASDINLLIFCLNYYCVNIFDGVICVAINETVIRFESESGYYRILSQFVCVQFMVFAILRKCGIN